MPLLLLLILVIGAPLYALDITSITPTADAKVNTTSPLFISGDELIYSNDSSEITGKGNVIAKSEELTIFSDSIYVNNNTGEAIAEGHVLAIDNGTSIYTDKITYNLKQMDSYAEHVDILSSPWICRGDKLKKVGNKTEITNPVFTTCDLKTPHFRMQASSVYIYENEKIESWNTVIYLGALPVFYFPYFAQPLKGQKKPFDITFGHNDYAGWYANTFYNIHFNSLNQLGLGFNYMELVGTSYLVNAVYGFSKDSIGTFSGSLTDELKTTKKRRWSASYTHNQTFDERTRLNIRASSMSDGDLAKNFLDTQGIDMFRHDYGASFSTGIGSNQSIGISVADAETLNTITASYQTASRTLPSFNYNLTSTQILPRLYYNHSFNLNRIYNTQDGGYYSDTAYFAPSLSFSIPSFYILSMSANAGLTSAWENTNENKKKFFEGDLINSLNLSENASVDLLPYGFLRANIRHAYSKRLNKLEGLAHAGISANNASISLNGGTGFFSFNSSVNYDLLTVTAKSGFDVERLSMINFSANTMSGNLYFSGSGLYSPYVNMIKNLTLSMNLRDTGVSNMWSISVMTNYVNNILDTTGHSATVRTPDTMSFVTSLNFNLTPEFSFNMNRQYDLTIKQLTSEAYSATWHLHCWEASISYTKRPDKVEEYFFTIFISAIPEAKFNKPTSATPDYKLDQLMNN
ncbi:MAG: hypothetical protein WCJ94_07735 [bacterium]